MPELIEAAKEAAFALETVAHLQGREKTLLPIAERLRNAIAASAANTSIASVDKLDPDRRRAMGFPKRVDDGKIAIDEICSCGALRSHHGDTLQLGHGPNPETHCAQFTFARWMLA